MTFRVGQKVVCVDAKEVNGFVNLVEGKIYEVAGFKPLKLNPGMGLVLVGDEGHGVGYFPHRFRPIAERKTDISIFTAVLKPSKVEA